MSDHRTTPLRPEGEDLLQAALADPFSVIPNVPRVSPSQPAPQSSQPAPQSSPPSDSDLAPAAAPEQQQQQPGAPLSVSAAEQEAWRAEHEAQNVEWRRQSADVRARAEAERARWEERRARERAEQAQRLERQQQQAVSRSDTGASASGESTSEWEAVSQRSTSAFVSGSSSTAASPSASLLPPGDAPGGPATDNTRSGGRAGAPSSQSQGSRPQNLPRSTTTNPNVPAPRAAGGQQTAAARDPSDSPQWENVSSSPTSSFPSMSFPEPSRPHSPEHSHAPRTTSTTTAPAARPAMAASATLAVFDSSLPASARFWALLSSLSINMFLPFVNGVMLGFGEIFAKTVIVGWLGWGPTVATTVGLGTRSRSQNGR